MSKAKGRILVDGKVVAEFVDVTFTINKPIEPIEVINEQIVLPVFECQNCKSTWSWSNVNHCLDCQSKDVKKLHE